MNLKRTAILAIIVALVWLAAPGPILAQGFSQFNSQNTTLEILPAEVFKARYGNNPQVPKTEEEIIALARRIFVPAVQVPMEAAEPVEECGTSDLLLLQAALQNPEVSDATRRLVALIQKDPVPEPFEYTEIFGHFRFHWWENHPQEPRHNVTRAQIANTASYLNKYWQRCVKTLRIWPLHSIEAGQELIDVKVFYCPSYSGLAIRDEITIHLNSTTVVRQICRRKSVPAHELFHMVQYTCEVHKKLTDYKWLVEGSAVWAQKWLLEAAGVAPVYDYILRMNEGLAKTDNELMVEREYDAALFWVYLTEQAGWEAMRSILLKIKNQETKDFKAAVAAVVKQRLGLTFDKFVHKWSKANYIKVMKNATPEYDYTEDGQIFTSCRRKYKLSNLTPSLEYKILDNNATWKTGWIIGPYAATYFKIKLGPEVTRVRLQVKGQDEGNYSFWFMGIKENQGLKTVQTFNNTYEYNQNLTPGQWDHLMVMVMGRSKGGEYLIQSIPPPGPRSCMDGDWLEKFSWGNGATWKLGFRPDGTIFGSYIAWEDCKLFASATYDAGKVELQTTPNVDKPNGCRSVTISGQLSGCNTIIGTWKDKYSTRQVTLTKLPAQSAAVAEEDHYQEGCPTCP